MTKQEFINKYGISDAMPITPSKKGIPAEALSCALSEFFSHKFPGVIRVDVDEVSAQSVMINAEYLAYFFKLLLSDLYGREMLCLAISCDKKELYLNISAESTLPISESEERDLIRHARNAGFRIYPEGNGFLLTAPFSPAMIRRVYAISVFDGRRAMIGKLVEIFCHGELMSATPPPRPKMPEPIKRQTKKTVKKDK